MGRTLKTIIVGLPLFAERLANSLSEFDPTNRYNFLNTYYSKKDKLKARFMIPRADLLFSINGSVVTSGIFDLAIRKKVPIIMNWVGTDVLLARDAIKSGNFREEYISYAKHFCEVNWIQDELKAIGIEAEIVNFASFDRVFDLQLPKTDRLTVLSYIAKIRSDFYGIDNFLKAAERLPEIDFLIAGTEAEEYAPLPSNVRALGWVQDMQKVYDQTHVCVRMPEHDGLSTFILESLARGKQVIYKYPFNHCHVCETEDELVMRLKELEQDLKSGNWTVNTEGASFIREHFNKERILGDLLQRIKTVVQ
jgi:glycosyltransferase involved in cell wall biosynthesis